MSPGRGYWQRMGDAQEAFGAVVSGLEYPMFVVTAATPEERSGCLVGFATQCSIDPPRMIVCLSKRNHTYRVAGQAGILRVRFLRSTDLDIAKLFGGGTGGKGAKFNRCR